jgi:hypothetical protein
MGYWMARRAFFSFHYANDIWRVSQIRNSWVTQDRETAGFWDAADWEKVKRAGDGAIKRWIDRQLDGTSVTVVLIGSETAERTYVRYEIARSHERGNGLLGVRIHRLKNSRGLTSSAGRNPFDDFYVQRNGSRTYLSETYPVYDWVSDDGYPNFADWIEEAASDVGR